MFAMKTSYHCDVRQHRDYTLKLESSELCNVLIEIFLRPSSQLFPDVCRAAVQPMRRNLNSCWHPESVRSTVLSEANVKRFDTSPTTFTVNLKPAYSTTDVINRCTYLLRNNFQRGVDDTFQRFSFNETKKICL